MKDFAKEFYFSTAWKGMREYIKKRDGYLCQDCLKKGRITPAEEVHHIIHLTPSNIHDTSITLNEDNLISLCRECHRARHGDKNSRRRYTVDEFGRVTIKED